MLKNVYFVGLDIACDDFVASIYQSPKQSIITKEGIENTFDGFNENHEKIALFTESR